MEQNNINTSWYHYFISRPTYISEKDSLFWLPFNNSKGTAVFIFDFLFTYLFHSLNIRLNSRMAKFLYPFFGLNNICCLSWRQDLTSHKNSFYMFLSQAFRCLISFLQYLISFFPKHIKKYNLPQNISFFEESITEQMF